MKENCFKGCFCSKEVKVKSCFPRPWREKVGGAREKGDMYASQTIFPSSALWASSLSRGEAYGGFTLVELLVVVLIIGILAAVAVPKYQKAVEKSKAVQAMELLKSLAVATEMHKLTNGTFPRTFNDLDVTIPANFQPAQVISDVIEYFPRVAVSDGEWNLQIHYASYNNFTHNCHSAITMIRLNGIYEGTGFSYSGCGNGVKLLCYEPSWEQNKIGSFCGKLFKAKHVGNGRLGRSFSL